MTNDANLKILLYDPDIYGLHAINSYLAWDRRTRVVARLLDYEGIFDWLTAHAEAEWPDIVILDVQRLVTPEAMVTSIHRLQANIPGVQIMLLDHYARLEFALAGLENNANGYFLRNDVGLQIAWSVVWAQAHDYAVSRGVRAALDEVGPSSLLDAPVLPDRRRYPELTERIRQAIQLCVVEGMSADLAADEMGVSTHTIRSYVKEGYRILEAADKQEYPVGMSAQERAFMRFTALDDSDDIPPEDSDDAPPEEEG